MRVCVYAHILMHLLKIVFRQLMTCDFIFVLLWFLVYDRIAQALYFLDLYWGCRPIVAGHVDVGDLLISQMASLPY